MRTTAGLLAEPAVGPGENHTAQQPVDPIKTEPPTEDPRPMHSIHPIVNEQLMHAKAQELHRIAGHTRLHRESIHRRIRERRRP
jgi:hypothetical protein